MRLFDDDLPAGFEYRDAFLDESEEAMLIAHVGRLEFSNFEMRGVVARRRVAFFGRSYDNRTVLTRPFPGFLIALRDKVAEWAGIDAEGFAMALVNEYRPGAPIGWHRDAPQYDKVAGVSLASSSRIRFRPYVSPAQQASARERRRTATHEVTLPPRSAYLMAGEARSAYEHSIPPVPELRYSITFRTFRGEC